MSEESNVRKTTVYLTDEEADGLRQLAANKGTSQAQLIRDGVRQVLAEGRRRTFHSMGRGAGSGEPTTRWDAEALRQKVLGRE